MANAAAKGHRRSKLHEEHEEHVNHERWLITYADMITLLMVLFIVLYSISQVDLAKFRRLKEGTAGGFGGPAAAGALSGGAGPLEGGGGIFDAGLNGTEALYFRGTPPGPPALGPGCSGGAGRRPGPCRRRPPAAFRPPRGATGDPAQSRQGRAGRHRQVPAGVAGVSSSPS